MLDKSKSWARERMAPQTWERVGRSASNVRQAGIRSASASRRWVSVGGEHVTSMRSARMEPWRLLLATALTFLCAFALSPFDGAGDDPIPILFLVICVGASTYMADWVGGVAATLTAVVCIDAFFLGRTPALDAYRYTSPTFTQVVFVLCAAATVMTIEHLKYDRANARLEAASLRAANTALTAVEISAGRRAPGDQTAYLNVLSAILTAMVRVNRASVGALYLLDATNSTLVRAATYGELEGLEDTPRPAVDIPIGAGLAGRVARERRPVSVYDTLVEEDVEDILATNSHIRSAVGVPLIDSADRLVGVAWVGLYVPYRFAMTAIARLNALANRTTAFMEAAKLADDQDELLDQVQYHYRRLQAVIQTIPEAVMVARAPSGTIVASNAAAQRMFGVRPDGPVNLRRADRLSVVSPTETDVENPILRAMREGSVVTGVELTVRQPDGERVPVVASAAPVPAEDGTIDAVVGIFQDVGPLKEAERLRDEFISIVSHELRSPLTPIRGFAQIVARDLQREGSHEQHVAWLDSLQSHIDRITRLVDDLLDVSRLRAGRLKILSTPTDIIPVCASVVDTWNAASSTHRVVMQTEQPSWITNVDADRIHQVLDNLVSNAVKYADPGTITVQVSAGSLPGGVEGVNISVIDEGPGIQAMDRDAVFTPFYRTRSASQSAVPGLGLGLYISSEIIQGHGGTLSVSATEQGGSRFTITLPSVPQAPAT
jgi:PAS domain S-box-containing protein